MPGIMIRIRDLITKCITAGYPATHLFMGLEEYLQLKAEIKGFMSVSFRITKSDTPAPGELFEGMLIVKTGCAPCLYVGAAVGEE